MSYDGYHIEKHSSCWVLHHPSPEHVPVSGKTKKACMALLARLFLQQEQSILAEAYQELMRQKNECYGYCDALDALIHEATYNSKHFIEVLRPQLKTIAQSSGSAVFEVEYLD